MVELPLTAPVKKPRPVLAVEPGEIGAHIKTRQLFKMMKFDGSPGGFRYAVGGPHIDGGYYLIDELVTKVSVWALTPHAVERKFREMIPALAASQLLRVAGRLN